MDPTGISKSPLNNLLLIQRIAGRALELPAQLLPCPPSTRADLHFDYAMMVALSRYFEQEGDDFFTEGDRPKAHGREGANLLPEGESPRALDAGSPPHRLIIALPAKGSGTVERIVARAPGAGPGEPLRAHP